jgi:hypothetical protein
VRGVGRWALAAALAGGLLTTGVGRALDLTVDPAGGPLTLEDEVAAALSDWRAAGVDPDLVDADVRVAYGAEARFGPDAVVWVLLRSRADAIRPTYEVLVAPGATALRSALIPALGVVLGGSLGAGALDPLLDPSGPRRPTEAEGAEIEARRTALPGDLDGDGVVGFEDLLLMAAAYGQRGVNLAADLDASGVVDAADLDLLRSSYTFDPPLPTD